VLNFPLLPVHLADKMVRSNALRSLSALTLQTRSIRSVPRVPFARQLSTSPILSLAATQRRFLATPSTGPQQVTPSATAAPPDFGSSNGQQPSAIEKHEAGKDAAVPEQWTDYSKGPSAIDKAAQLFFFTEIIRGMFIVLEQFFRELGLSDTSSGQWQVDIERRTEWHLRGGD